ncbi:MAG TPA: DUF2092 domain-containing protein [Pseudolabrys sp.]|jgi:hypothetical protein
MSLFSQSWSRRRVAGWCLAVTLALPAGLLGKPAAQAQDAGKILKAMSDYVANQKVISAKFDSTIEVITADLQKIQFASSGELLLSRPNKLRVARTGGYADIEIIFDGKTAIVHGKNVNAFARLDAPGSIDQLVDRLRDQLSVSLPGADLLVSNAYDALMSDVVDAKHIGQGVIDGVECEHLAFRNPDTDWQIWVETGPRPIPRKYVITSKAVTGGPQYTLLIKDWKTDAQIGPEAFAFKPPADAKEIEFKALAELDEVPPGQASGEKK